MSIVPTNNLNKLGIAAAHSMRLELADQLYYPIGVDVRNPAQPMSGGTVGNRSGQPQRLTSGFIDGNTGGYGADFSALEGDPVAVVKTMTSDGPIFTIQQYNGQGIITAESPLAPAVAPGQDYSIVARYIVKADGYIYDLLALSIQEDNIASADGPYSHWRLAADIGNAATYNAANNTYTPSIAPTAINESHYTRRVGQISFRPKDGASSGAIQEQLSRAQSTLDTMSRLLRSLHDEAKGPFANFVIR
ncbi:MAG: hypothetical protein IGS03_17250 [Candidatus Sericytochromatia bacterium]|nr:hypothetical protein [Candidatus Sericytochromatia bacterium]